jgi:23S rRNA-intervening sequence protein
MEQGREVPVVQRLTGISKVRDGGHCGENTWQLAFSSWHLANASNFGGLMKDFRDLHVWEGSHRLTLAIYALTSKFPREELYGLTSQIRRCAVSVDSNIAEGCGKTGKQRVSTFPSDCIWIGK